MEIIHGTPISTLPNLHLVKIGDLINYEGPFLSLFTNDKADNYLYFWCDADEQRNRWMIFRVSESDLSAYLSRKIPLRDLILRPGDGFIWLTDINSELEYENTFLIDPSHLPLSYLPDANSFYVFEPSFEHNIQFQKQGYKIHIDGEWTIQEFGHVPHKYSQLYAFLFSLKNLEKPALDHAYSAFPWRGGYSTVHFFNNLAKRVGSENRRVLSIQYASPGWIELDIDPNVAYSIKVLIGAFVGHYEIIETEYKKAYAEMGKRDLLRDVDQKDLITDDDFVFIENALQTFSHSLGLNDQIEKINELTGNQLISLKVILSLYRVVEQLAKYQKNGKARY